MNNYFKCASVSLMLRGYRKIETLIYGDLSRLLYSVSSFNGSGPAGIWIKIYLSLKTVVLAFIVGSIQVMFSKKTL
jgi:hypothetical protein